MRFTIRRCSSSTTRETLWASRRDEVRYSGQTRVGAQEGTGATRFRELRQRRRPRRPTPLSRSGSFGRAKSCAKMFPVSS
jgi:hypothetical protein